MNPKVRSIEAPLACETVKLPCETLLGNTKVVAKAAAAFAVWGDREMIVPGATFGAGTTVVVALAASENVPVQFNRPCDICSIAVWYLVRSFSYRPGARTLI